MDTNNHYESFSVEDCVFQNVSQAWQQLLADSAVNEDIYKTPWYYEFLQQRQDKPHLSLLKLVSGSGKPLAFVPLMWDDREFRFDISLYSLCKIPLRVMRLLGHEWTLPASISSHDALFINLYRKMADAGAIWLNSVSTNSYLFNYFKTSAEIRKYFFIYIPFGPRRCHVIPLPDSFKDYKAKLSKKKRYNLNRQFQQLSQYLQTDVNLQRLSQPKDFSTLVDAINALIPAKIRPNTELLAELAEFAQRGHLLCYVLRSDDKFIALVLGFLYAETYHIFSTEYDDALHYYSPGTTLQHLLIEDVINNQFAKKIDLGFGEGKYRHTSTNDVEERATVILCKKTLANFVFITMHRLFYAGIDYMEPVRNLDYANKFKLLKQFFNKRV